MSMAENIDTAIKDIENNFSGGLSNTSTKKFDALVAIVSTITGLPADEIYPTSVVARASNVWNRLSQGKPLNKHFSLAIAIGAKGAEGGMMAPLASFIGDGNVHYDTIAPFNIFGGIKTAFVIAPMYHLLSYLLGIA